MDDQQAGGTFDNVPIEIRICVGRARPSVRELLEIGDGTILRLDRGIDDPVELFVADKMIAHGELEMANDEDGGGLRVRITRLIDADH